VVENGRCIVLYCAIEACARCCRGVLFALKVVLTAGSEWCLRAKQIARQCADGWCSSSHVYRNESNEFPQNPRRGTCNKVMLGRNI